MAASEPHAISPRRAREGFVLLVALVALVPAAKAVLYDTLDPDSFIHLIAADEMTRQGIGPIVDHSSYMSVREPWTPYSWLAEFAMRFVWNHGGYRAALACHALMGVALVCLYALACATRVPPLENPDDSGDSDRLVRVALATAFAAYLSIPYLSFRPVTAALVLMAPWVWLLVRDRMRGERTRAVWLLVPLTALLINLHLYAILIPAWLAALWAGAAWELWHARLDEHDEAKRRLVRYTVLLIGSALACLATPMLPGAVKSIAYYQSRDPMVAGPTVAEYRPFYSGTSGMISAVLVILTLCFAYARRRVLRAGEFFWLAGSVVLLLRMGRFTPVFAMAAAPMLAATLPRLNDRVLARGLTRVAVAIILGIGLMRVFQAFPRAGTPIDAWLERNGPAMPGYPARAAAFVEANVPPSTGRLINDYSWGGYLSWRLGPRGFKVLLDGRTNVFPPEFWRATYLGSSEELGTLLERVNADAAILPQAGSRIEAQLTSQGWTTAYADGRATVLVPPGSPLGSPQWRTTN